jgi:hypothetical protein
VTPPDKLVVPELGMSERTLPKDPPTSGCEGGPSEVKGPLAGPGSAPDIEAFLELAGGDTGLKMFVAPGLLSSPILLL